MRPIVFHMLSICALLRFLLLSLRSFFLASIIEIIDKHRKNCLWRGTEFRNKGYNLAAWDLVRKPKDKGGLGVINLSVQNDALLIKHLNKIQQEGQCVVGQDDLGKILQ